MKTYPEIRTADGRTLVVHETGAGPGAAEAGAAEPRAAAPAFTLFWHNGSPHSGELLPPIVEAAEARNIRVVTYARPSYGGSSPNPGRNVASAASDVASIADSLGIERFAVMGASGGGPHALACAALLPDRVFAAVTLAGVAPFSDAFDWFGGMASPGALQAARQGRDARARYAVTETFDPAVFTPADWAALDADWRSLGADANRAGDAGPDGLIDDDTAFATDWGFDPATIATPVLLIHGKEDRMVPASHSQWLVPRIPAAELWLRPDDGHVSVLHALPLALDWLAAHEDRRAR